MLQERVHNSSRLPCYILKLIYIRTPESNSLGKNNSQTATRVSVVAGEFEDENPQKKKRNEGWFFAPFNKPIMGMTFSEKSSYLRFKI